MSGKWYTGWGWINDGKFEDLLGKTITNIEGLEKDSRNVLFECSDGTQYEMYHEQDCCEYVAIEDVCGEVNCLLNSPITMAEESSSSNIDLPGYETYDYWDDSYTWTFYKLATVKGYVTIRWLGMSNGYYSESVDFVRIGGDQEDW